jgi:hypothetical protein
MADTPHGQFALFTVNGPNAYIEIDGNVNPTSYTPTFYADSLMPANFTFSALSDYAANFNNLNSNGVMRGDLASATPNIVGIPLTFTMSAVPEPGAVLLTNAVVAGGKFQFSFASVPGHTHPVKYTTNLLFHSWQTLTNIPGDGTLKTIQVPATNAACFFEVMTQ